MDRLAFCRKHLEKLNFNELSCVYNYLTAEYSDEEYVVKNSIKEIEEILIFLNDCSLTHEDWMGAIYEGHYNVNDKYLSISPVGIISFNDINIMRTFVDKKMNGEAMDMIEEYLENKGITNNLKYVVVHDVENKEFHLHRLCDDGNPSNRREIVGCESLHEIFELAKGLNISKNDIVDYMRRDEIKQYSQFTMLFLFYSFFCFS